MSAAPPFVRALENEECVLIVLTDPSRWGGDGSFAVIWARLVLKAELTRANWRAVA